MLLSGDKGIEVLTEVISGAQRLVFFGGAGVSTESGIPDFRSPGGVFSKPAPYPPEVMLSYSFFLQRPEPFYEFYRERCLTPILDAQPNAAHQKLAQWEAEGRLSHVVTQNIDGLHQKGGSKHVLELHGSASHFHCMSCHKPMSLSAVVAGPLVPLCGCGGLVRPNIVLYEESLDQHTLDQAIRAIAQADTLMIAGSSMQVYPAASLVRYFRGNNIILINRDACGADGYADYKYRGNIAAVLDQIN